MLKIYIILLWIGFELQHSNPNKYSNKCSEENGIPTPHKKRYEWNCFKIPFLDGMQYYLKSIGLKGMNHQTESLCFLMLRLHCF